MVRALLVAALVTVALVGASEVRDAASLSRARVMRHQMQRIMALARANNCSTEEKSLDDVLADLLGKQSQRESEWNANCTAKYTVVNQTFDAAVVAAKTVKDTATGACDDTKTTKIAKLRRTRDSGLHNLTLDADLAEAKANHTTAQQQCTDAKAVLATALTTWTGKQDEHKTKLNVTAKTYGDDVIRAQDELNKAVQNAKDANTDCDNNAKTAQASAVKTCNETYQSEQATFDGQFPLISNVSQLYDAWRACENGRTNATTPVEGSFLEVEEALSRKASAKCQHSQTLLQRAHLAARTTLMVRGAFDSIFESLRLSKQQSEQTFADCKKNATDEYTADYATCGDEMTKTEENARGDYNSSVKNAEDTKVNRTRIHNTDLARHESTYNAAVVVENTTAKNCVAVKAALDEEEARIVREAAAINGTFASSRKTAEDFHTNCTGAAEQDRLDAVALARGTQTGDLAMERKACADQLKLIADEFKWVSVVGQAREADKANQAAATTPEPTTTAAPTTTTAAPTTTTAAPTTTVAPSTTPVTVTEPPSTPAPTSTSTSTAAGTTAAVNSQPAGPSNIAGSNF
jgi:hypothetical protein